MEKENAFINDVLKYMLFYQSNNNVKGCCIQNCQYFYDMARVNCSNVQLIPKAVIVVYNTTINGVEGTACHVHMILEDQDGKIIDPSYEVHSLHPKLYFTSVKKLTDCLKKNQEHTPARETIIKTAISAYLKFLDYEKRILNPHASTQSNEEIYNSQAAFIRSLM